MSEHPTSEELAEYLYDELAPQKRDAIARHLGECAQCRADVDAWRGARQALAAWQLPARPNAAARPVSFFPRFARWAAAAIVLLCVGYGIGRMAQRSPDLPGLRAALAQQIKSDLRGEFQDNFTKLAVDQAQQRQDYQRALVQAVSQLEARRQADYTMLRQDVDTIALGAQQGLDSLAAGQRGLQQAVYEIPSHK